MKKILMVVLVIVALNACKQKIEYPETKTVDQKDDYFGTIVKDPYRWLEDGQSAETAEWVKEENKVTNAYLEAIPFREKLKKRLTEIWNYEKYSAPSKKGDYYIFSKNDGLQEQSVVYYQKGLNAEPKIFLDPNKLSDDGSVSLTGLYFSKDDKYCGYGISRGGSDWNEFYVMKVDDRNLLKDHIDWVKFSGMAWYKDGFFYSRYDAPEGVDRLKVKNEFQKLYYHKLGTPQADDKLVLQDKQNPQRGFGSEVTEDQKYLVITIWEGSAENNLLSFKDLKRNSKIMPVFDKVEAEYTFIDNIGSKFLILTNNDAANKKVVLVDPYHPQKSNWETIIPESKNVISGVSITGGKIFVEYLKDANTAVSVFTPKGEKLYDVKLPGVGTAYGFGGNRNDKEFFYTFTSFTYPPTIFRYDIEANKSELFRKSEVKFNPDDYETKEIFYSSKDGTKIPMFITYKKGLKLDGNNPTILYAYGGFNIAMRPSFRVQFIPWLENGGVYAMACLRGGSEYGEEWHKAGMLDKKQNVFDDYIAGAEYLINEKYTSNKRLAALGGSNGGTLVGAVINQRPDLFGAAFPMVGVMDMLRFHKFTIGWAWVPEYGSSENEEQFKTLIKYSPLHNIKAGINYPPTMITTADHDDRVFPAHSFKYAATLQNTYKGDNPILIRIETQVGHGAGTSTSKSIELYTDVLAFAWENMDFKPSF